MEFQQPSFLQEHPNKIKTHMRLTSVHVHLMQLASKAERKLRRINSFGSKDWQICIPRFKSLSGPFLSSEREILITCTEKKKNLATDLAKEKIRKSFFLQR